MNTALILSIVALVAVVVLIVLLSMQNHKIADLREALDDATYDLQTAQQHFHDALPAEVLTRQEVQLLIDEEVSRNVQAIADAQAQAAANAYLTEPVVESPKVIYFGRPTAERMFDDERKTFEAYETSYYRFTLMKDEPEQAIKLATANSMRSMLTKAVTQSNGTGYGSQISRFQTFAKTGTTSDNCDKWYCGGTPHYVTAVWYGFDYRADLHTGTSNPAKTIFRYIFSKIHADLPQKTFTDVIEECGGAAKDATEMIKTDPVTTSATTTESTEPSEDDTTTTTEKPTAPTTAPTTAQPTAPPDGPQMAVDD